MVLVWVGHDHHVDGSLPEGQCLAQAAHRQVRVGTAVHQERGAVGRVYQDGVALADIEHQQVQPAVRLAGQRQ